MFKDIMKPSKKMYSEWFAEYKLTEADLKKLQQCLLKMFLDIRDLCDENGIKYMASGGTVLGAIRHKGFIPWDDDIDIMMSREEYHKFCQVFDEKKKEGYFKSYILAQPLKSKEYYFKIPKIYNCDTEYYSINYMGNPNYNMVSMDIFLIENIPDSIILRSVFGVLYNFSFYASTFCLDYIYPSPVIEEKSKENKEVRDYYEFRKTLGRFFSIFGGIKFYLSVCDRIANYKKKGLYLGLPSGISYKREVFRKEVLSETIEKDFCGYKVKIPQYYDEYLANLYGDYMKIPPDNKREIHVAYKLSL